MNMNSSTTVQCIFNWNIKSLHGIVSIENKISMGFFYSCLLWFYLQPTSNCLPLLYLIGLTIYTCKRTAL